MYKIILQACKKTICIGLLLLFSAGAVFAQNQKSREEMIRHSSLIFIGTIQKMDSVSIPGVKASSNTVIAKVNSILLIPNSVSLLTGDDITIKLKDTTDFREGVSATFYTYGWVLGTGLAVIEVGHELSRDIFPPLTKEQLHEQLKVLTLRDKIAKSDIVVIGRVIGEPGRASGAPEIEVISEHVPDWQEAVLEVESGLKGIHNGGRIVVRFPGSDDVAFYGVPKFKKDQEGVFFLKRDNITGLPKAILCQPTQRASPPRFRMIPPSDSSPGARRA